MTNESKGGMPIMPSQGSDERRWAQPYIKGSSYSPEQRHEDLIETVERSGCPKGLESVCAGCVILETLDEIETRVCEDPEVKVAQSQMGGGAVKGTYFAR